MTRSEGSVAVKYSLLAALLAALLLPSAASAKDIVMKEEGITTITSHHSVDETVDRLKEILRAKDVTLFALIDHSGEAAKAGMKMPPTKVLIFGNPMAGTPLMLAAPSVALDLPLKISGCRGRAGKGLALLQQPAVPERAVRPAGEPAPEHRRHRNPSCQGRRIARSK